MVLFREGGMKIKNVPRAIKSERFPNFPGIGGNGGITPAQIKSEFGAKMLANSINNSSHNSSGSKSPGPGFDCSACGRIYKLKSSLRNHQKWECGKEPQFSCPYCVYKAKQKMHIARHLERMHKCEVNSDAIIKTQQHAQQERQIITGGMASIERQFAEHLSKLELNMKKDHVDSLSKCGNESDSRDGKEMRDGNETRDSIDGLDMRLGREASIRPIERPSILEQQINEKREALEERGLLLKLVQQDAQ